MRWTRGETGVIGGFLRWWAVVAALAVAAALAPAAEVAPPAKRAPSAKSPAQTYLPLADQIESHWRKDLLPKWFPRCVDAKAGGFYPHFREDWTPGDQNDKTIVFQSRMTWVASQVAMRYPELRTEYVTYTRHGATFLARTMWDARDGGFFWALDASGMPAERHGGEKHVYGIAFAVYALAAAYEATEDKASLALAKQAFAWLERHAHDPVHGGYYEALSRDGRPILKPPPATGVAQRPRTTDSLGTQYGFKSMNAHIHVLEALTALARVWPDPAVRVRLEEVFLIVRDKIAVEPGCLNLFFTPDWRALPDHDSFGHDVETAFLLLEAEEVLSGENAAGPRGPPVGPDRSTTGERPPAPIRPKSDRPRDPARTLAVARSLVDHALDWGWDAQRGGFYEKGAAFAPAWDRSRVWWTQAEGLNALLLMHEHFGSQTPRYFDAFQKQWEFIGKYQNDAKHGGWHETVSADGSAAPGQSKSTAWKAAYHEGRALMNVAERLRKLARHKQAAP
jgi:mannobiose 2-epimerase